MNGFDRDMVRLLLLGAGWRLLGAAAVVVLLWAAFFWATGKPGAL